MPKISGDVYVIYVVPWCASEPADAFEDCSAVTILAVDSDRNDAIAIAQQYIAKRLELRCTVTGISGEGEDAVETEISSSQEKIIYEESDDENGYPMVWYLSVSVPADPDNVIMSDVEGCQVIVAKVH